MSLAILLIHDIWVCHFFVHSLCAIVIQPEIPVYHRNDLWSKICDLESSGRISHIPFLHTPFIMFCSPSFAVSFFTPHSCVCSITGIASASLFEFEINSSCLQLFFLKNIFVLEQFLCERVHVHSCVPKVRPCLLLLYPLSARYHLHYRPRGGQIEKKGEWNRLRKAHGRRKTKKHPSIIL